MSIVVYDFRLSHEASAEIFLQEPIKELHQAIEYLERRVIVLLAGAMAEADSAEDVGGTSTKHSLSETGDGATDYVKVQELIQLIRNLKFPQTTDTEQLVAELQLIMNDLWDRSVEAVKQEYDLIRTLATQLAPRIHSYGVPMYLPQEEVSALPGLQARFARHAIALVCSNSA